MAFDNLLRESEARSKPSVDVFYLLLCLVLYLCTFTLAE